MLTPKSPDGDEDFSPEDELTPIYNEVTMNKPIFTEEEWLAQFSIIEPQYNPVTADIWRDDED